MQNKLIEYYEGYDEDGRLRRDNFHKLEFATTTAYFDRLLPKGAAVLDVCAGTGAYAFYLAGKGHKVTACDLVPHNVEIMRSNPEAGRLADIRVCDALDLSGFASGQFDVVLCMGALYHLETREEKKKAVEQCAGVTKQGGLIALAYINKFALAILCANDDLSNMEEVAAIAQGKREDRVFSGSSPSEIVALAEQSGLETLHNIAADGMAYVIAEKINSAAEQHFAGWTRYHLSVCEEPSILGASLHGLYIGRRG